MDGRGTFLEYVLFYGGVAVISVCWAVAWFALVSSMLHKQLLVKRCVVFCAYFVLAQFAMNSVYLFHPWLTENYLLEAAQFTIHALVLAVCQRLAGKPGWAQTLGACALGYFAIYTFFYSIQTVFLNPLEAALSHGNAYVQIGALTLVYLSALVFSLLLAWLSRRVHFRKYWGSLFNTGGKAVLTLALCLAIMHAYRIALVLAPQWEESVAFSLTGFVFIFIVAFVLLFLGVFENNRARLAAQEAQMREQEAYVQALERIQGEVRAFRHDYQNLLAGLALQAARGDVAGLQRQLKDKLQYFDDHLAREIRHTTYLANIKQPQVKSLLLLKLAAMQRDGIPCELEVVAPVPGPQLETEDFLRVLGVFLDNAAEAAAGADKPFVGVVLLQEEHALHVVVKNTLAPTARPNLGEIWAPGYTTRGKGRGQGLANVRAILDRYPNAVCRSALEGELFVQQLTVKQGGAG